MISLLDQKKELDNEKAELQRQIVVNEEQIRVAKNAIHWLKKRIKLIEQQSFSMDVPVGVLNTNVSFGPVKENALSKDNPEKR